MEAFTLRATVEKMAQELNTEKFLLEIEFRKAHLEFI